LLERGQLVVDSPAEELRGHAVTLTGRSSAVEELAQPFTVLRRESMGALAAVTVYGDLDLDLRGRAAQSAVEVTPASLQQLVANAAALRAAAPALVSEPTVELGSVR
jgi:ABC-2 type transport system ATP-binding protein